MASGVKTGDFLLKRDPAHFHFLVWHSVGIRAFISLFLICPIKIWKCSERRFSKHSKESAENLRTFKSTAKRYTGSTGQGKSKIHRLAIPLLRKNKTPFHGILVSHDNVTVHASFGFIIVSLLPLLLFYPQICVLFPHQQLLFHVIFCSQCLMAPHHLFMYFI